MALGHRFATDADFEHAFEDYMASSQREGLHETESEHRKKGGWYSSEVIGNAITTVSMRNSGKVQYVMQLRPLYEKPLYIHSCVGAIVNIDNMHWVALKVVSGEIWLLDSESRPSKISEQE